MNTAVSLQVDVCKHKTEIKHIHIHGQISISQICIFLMGE